MLDYSELETILTKKGLKKTIVLFGKKIPRQNVRAWLFEG